MKYIWWSLMEGGRCGKNREHGASRRVEGARGSSTVAEREQEVVGKEG
jgi:hypothetical protein